MNTTAEQSLKRASELIAGSAIRLENLVASIGGYETDKESFQTYANEELQRIKDWARAASEAIKSL